MATNFVFQRYFSDENMKIHIINIKYFVLVAGLFMDTAFSFARSSREIKTVSKKVRNKFPRVQLFNSQLPDRIFSFFLYKLISDFNSFTDPHLDL